jgi:BirA family biotin operon repressor/biotin-[acetyl-CoA-carboxylase] ligase
MTISPSLPFDLTRLRRETSLLHVEYHDRLESTSTTAADLLPSLVQRTPALVLAATQTSGRGRTGNAWWSAPGALTCSWVTSAWDLPLDTSKRPLISLAAGLAARDVLASRLPRVTVSLKWPNDILAGGRKICGLLVEQFSLTPEPVIVVGVGVNVNNSLHLAPTPVATRATSLFDLTGQTFDLTDLLIDLLNQLDARIRQLACQPRLLMSEINRHHLLTARQVTVTQGEATLSGDCLGVDEEGRLVLQSHSGLLRCASGVVTAW